MKLLGAAAAALVLAALAAVPAGADDSGLSVRLTLGWDGAAASGSWIPYQVGIHNDSATFDFKGTVVIQAVATSTGGSADFGSSYQQPVSVPHAGAKDLTVYGAYLDSSMGISGYVAALVDATGREVARSPIAGVSTGRLAIGLLSDSQQALGEIKDSPLQAGPAGVSQLTAKTLPSTAVELGGLAAIVVDGFDSSTLSQAQGLALQQYVGLGGRLVVAGGAGWRRTLGSLPPDLLPLRQETPVQASLNPVLDLVAEHTDLFAASIAGSVASGARVVLSDAAGNPLLVELGYGAGQVLEVAFDPADQPVAGDAELARVTWSAILDRLGGPSPAIGKLPTPGVVLAGAGSNAGQVTMSRAALDDALTSLLNDTPANALPPLGMLGSLLVLYVLLAGPVNYTVLRFWRRRELMWVTVPLISVLFTGAAYAGGIAVHGRDYFVNEIQVLRLTPGGGIDAAAYDAVFSPERGDLTIRLGEASLASTYLPAPTGLSSGYADSVVDDNGPRVNLRNIAVWTPRDLKTEAAEHASLAVEAHLRLAGGHIAGTVVNHGRSSIRRVQLVTADGRVAYLASVLEPDVPLTVDAPLQPMPTAGGQPGGLTCNPSGCIREAATTPADVEQTVMDEAAGSLVSPENQVQALTAIVDPVPGFLINGARPTRTVTATLLAPVTLESVDTLTTGWSAPLMVAGNGLSAGPVSVVDLALPRLPAGAGLVISAATAAPIGTGVESPTATVEVYDWAGAAWRPADLSHAFQLSAGERGPDLVRLRVRGSLYLQGLQVVSR